MTDHETIAGRTQCMCVSAPGLREPCCALTGEHRRYTAMLLVTLGVTERAELMLSPRVERAGGSHG